MESGFGKSAQLTLASSPEMFQHPEILACTSIFVAHSFNVPPSLRNLLGKGGMLGLIYASFRLGRIYRRIAKEIRGQGPISLLIIPFIDDCLIGLGCTDDAFAGTSWVGITMRTMFHYIDVGIDAPPQKLRWLRRFILLRIMRQPSLKTLFSIDPTFAAYSNEQSEPEYRKVAFLPDPAAQHSALPSRHNARTALNIPYESKVVLLYGEIATRKGVFSLLRSAADSRCSESIFVLLAGRSVNPLTISENSAFQQLREQGRVRWLNGYVNEEQEPDLLAATDCMWVGYTDFYGMSGVMVLAARHSIPVIASKQGLIGFLTKSYDIGRLVDPAATATVITALNSLEKDPSYWEAAGKRASLAFAKHGRTDAQHLFSDHAYSAIQRRSD
jgi:glycosyltransferase involved in cell wall biosynthesis